MMRHRIVGIIVALLMAVARCNCAHRQNPPPSIGPLRPHEDEESTTDRYGQPSGYVASTRSFSMSDLSTLSNANVPVEHIEGADYKIADNEQRATIPVSVRAMYDISAVGTAPTATTRPSDTPLNRFSEISSSKNIRMAQRAIPAVQHDPKSDGNGVPVTYDQVPCPHSSINRRPYPPPQPTPHLSESGPPIQSTRLPRLRPAYRVHIRANGHGLEPFLHLLMATITGFNEDNGPASEQDAAQMTLSEMDSESEGFVDDTAFEEEPNADPKVKRTFRQRRPDEFVISYVPATVTKPAYTKVVDNDDPIDDVTTVSNTAPHG